MKNYQILLAAIALFGQVHRMNAQTTATSQGQAMDHLFSTVIRSSAESTDRQKNKPEKDISVANLSDLRRCCEKISGDIQRVYFLRTRNGKMKLQVRGVYAHGAVLFFWLQLNNRSSLDYDVDSIAFQITAVGKRQPSSVTAKTLTPVYVFDSTSTIPGHSRVMSIFVLPRFTLSAGRQLTIHVQEKNGGRNLQLQATNWTLERARPV